MTQMPVKLKMLCLKKKFSLYRTLCSECRKDFSLLRNLNEPLVKATRHGHDECVKVMIEAGADVNKPDKYGNTALDCAVQQGNVICMKVLIEAGADVNKQTVAAGIMKLGSNIFRKGTNSAGHTPLTRAARNGYAMCVKTLINAGADVNKQELNGRSPLMEAAAKGNNKCMKILLQAGADVNVISDNGRTALNVSVLLLRSGECVRLLLRAGAKVNITFGRNNFNTLQHTIFCLAIHNCETRNKATVMLLFAAGETIDGIYVEGTDLSGCIKQFPVPDYLLNEDLKLNLKHLCRETIRNHLINIDPHTHLFGRVPQLGLPGSIVLYLLYNLSLDE